MRRSDGRSPRRGVAADHIRRTPRTGERPSALIAALPRALAGLIAAGLLIAGQGLPVAWGSAGSVTAPAPEAPVAIAISEVTSSTATVGWVAPDTGIPVSEYDIFLDGKSQMTTAETTITIDGLIPNTGYEVEVFSVGENGERSAGGAVARFVTTDSDGAALGIDVVFEPAVPDGVNGWYRTAPQVSLSSIPATQSATLYRAVDSTETLLPYDGPFIAPTGEHRLIFEAHDPLGVRPVGSRSLVTKVDTAATEAPGGVDVLIVAGMASVAWEPVEPTASGVEHYNVYRNDEKVAETDGTVATVTGLEPQSAYEFSVTAVNGAGAESDPSDGVFIMTDPAIVPNAPPAVYARGVEGGSVLLSWQPPSAVVGDVSYIIRRSQDGVTFTQVATVSGYETFSHIDTGLRSSAEYWYTVSTVDDRGESMPSLAAAALTGAPQRVTGVSATDSPGGISISWSPSENPAAAGYHVYRSDVSLGQAVRLTAVPVMGTAYLDSVLESGRTYWYRVTVVDDLGAESPASVEVAGTPELVQEFDLRPHGARDAAANNCIICHRPHGAMGPKLSAFRDTFAAEEVPGIVGPPRATAAAQAACLSCHNGVKAPDTRTEFDAQIGSRHPVALGNDDGVLHCGSCHKSHRASEDDPALLLSGGASTGTAVCYGCHGAGSGLQGGDLRAFEGSAHFGLENDSQADIACATCHEPHSSRNESLLKFSGWMNCVRCHDVSSPDAPGAATLLTGGQEFRSIHVMTAEERSLNGSAMSCANCHSPMSLTADNPLVDPDNPSPAGAWGSADRNDFCLRCHDGALPTSEQIGTWAGVPLATGGSAEVVDIATAWQFNAHGHGTSDGGGPRFLRPHMGYSAGDVLECTTCHGTHGTANPLNLRTDVPSAGGSVGNQAALVAPVPGGGYDLRFFCNSCHEVTVENHLTATGGHVSIAQFPMDCTSGGCHSHTTAPAGTSSSSPGTQF